MKKWKCCLTAIVIAAGSMLVGCQESSSAKPIEAMYIPAGEDGHLMVGEGTGNVFTVTMPDNIQDKNGKKISEEDLNRGDIVAIYGDEIMLESYPGQYPGVTKIKVVKEGKASDADQYQDILDEFWPEKDPGELPVHLMVKSAQQPRAEDTAGAMQIKMGLNRIKRQTVQQSLSGQISLL